MDLFREECAATIATLPPEVQHITAERVTAGLQTFKEEVIAMVAAKDATGSTVIEVEDIQEIIQNMKSRLQKEGKL